LFCWFQASDVRRAAPQNGLDTKPPKLYNEKYFLSIERLREIPLHLALIKKPLAFLPIGMSLSALALVLLHAARYGIIHEADEGPTAHLFQILMAAQVPLVAFFALKWLPEVPGQTLRVLAMQIGAALAAFAAVYWLT
jgi:hypothetical protein